MRHVLAAQGIIPKIIYSRQACVCRLALLTVVEAGMYEEIIVAELKKKDIRANLHVE